MQSYYSYIQLTRYNFTKINVADGPSQKYYLFRKRLANTTTFEELGKKSEDSRIKIGGCLNCCNFSLKHYFNSLTEKGLIGKIFFLFSTTNPVSMLWVGNVLRLRQLYHLKLMNHDIGNMGQPHSFPPGKICWKILSRKDKYWYNQFRKAFW